MGMLDEYNIPGIWIREHDMRIRNKKTFELSSIKKYKQYERKLWLIPLACFLFSAVSVSGKAIHEFMEKPSIETVLGMLLFLLVSTLVLSLIPFFAGKVLITIKRKIAIENCTITNIQDFDYYRDKLTGLSPATISILTDLEIEQKKDVTASILQYENLGLLEEGADHTYHATKKYDTYSDLNDSDRYLIEHLQKGDFDWDNDTQWKQMVMNEAILEGYITKKTASWVNQQKEENPSQVEMHADTKKGFLVLGIWLCLIMVSLPALLEFDRLLETAPENPSFSDFTKQLNFLYSNPKMLLGAVLVIVVIIFTMYIIAYVVAVLSPEGTSIVKSLMQETKRTDYGNQMAECVYGMKNFIHDYSNLSMADKRQVVLWEDYLVYAVLLEENEEIVNEITKTRREIL